MSQCQLHVVMLFMLGRWTVKSSLMHILVNQT